MGSNPSNRNLEIGQGSDLNLVQSKSEFTGYDWYLHEKHGKIRKDSHPVNKKPSFFEESDDVRKILKQMRKLEAWKNHMERWEDLNENTIVEIDLFLPQDRKFVFKTKRLRFPEIKELKLSNMDEDTGEESCNIPLNQFMKHSFTQPIKYLYLDGGESGKLEKFSAGLNKLLPKITEEIFIVNFTIDSKTLKKVLGLLFTFH